MCLERPPLALSLNADPDSESDWTPVTTPASQYVQYLFSDTLQYYSGTVPFSPRAETVCKVIYIYPQPKTRIVKKCSRHAYIIKQDPRPSPPSGRLTQGANKSEMTYRAVGSPQDAQNTPSRMWREQPRVVLGDSTNYVVYVPGTRETPQKLISVTCELVELSFSPHPTTLEISALIIMWMGLLLPLVVCSLRAVYRAYRRRHGPTHWTAAERVIQAHIMTSTTLATSTEPPRCGRAVRGLAVGARLSSASHILRAPAPSLVPLTHSELAALAMSHQLCRRRRPFSLSHDCLSSWCRYISSTCSTSCGLRRDLGSLHPLEESKLQNVRMHTVRTTRSRLPPPSSEAASSPGEASSESPTTRSPPPPSSLAAGLISRRVIYSQVLQALTRLVRRGAPGISGLRTDPCTVERTSTRVCVRSSTPSADTREAKGTFRRFAEEVRRPRWKEPASEHTSASVQRVRARCDARGEGTSRKSAIAL